MLRLRVLFNLSVFLTVSILFLYFFNVIDKSRTSPIKNESYPPRFTKPVKPDTDYNLWLIFTKVIDKSPLMYSFNNLITNLLNVSSIPLSFHIIIDDGSEVIARRELGVVSSRLNLSLSYAFYDVEVFAGEIKDIVESMMPHFSSKPGTYYSDTLFYISLGLYRLAPKTQRTAVMLDCDLYFKKDVLNLFNEFKGFKGHLFGLAPELSPVYRHILFDYKQKHNETSFGDFYHTAAYKNSSHPKGFQGYNSGVVLFNLTALRDSVEYRNVIEQKSVASMVKKYNFRGHLGDQDFYSLLGYERPEMIKTLNCGFNRQLCTWWKDKGGYKDVFDDYFQCKHEVIIVHGNCNTKILRD